jgi:membrane protein implicated in regulation of membrane protease activity
MVEFWIAIACLVLGLAFLVGETLSPGFFLAIPATVMIGLGLLGFVIPSFLFGWGAAVAVPILGGFGTLATIWAYKKWAPAGDKPITLVADSLPGRLGKITDGERVRVQGQEFRFHGDFAQGQQVRVVSVDGFTLELENA